MYAIIYYKNINDGYSTGPFFITDVVDTDTIATFNTLKEADAKADKLEKEQNIECVVIDLKPVHEIDPYDDGGKSDMNYE